MNLPTIARREDREIGCFCVYVCLFVCFLYVCKTATPPTLEVRNKYEWANIKIETLEHGVTSVYISFEASKNRYIETCNIWNIQIISDKYSIIVYTFEYGDRCI